MPRRRAFLLALASQVPIWAIIAVGFATDHAIVGIFVVVGLLVLTQVVATVLSVRKSKARARPKRS